MGWTHGLLLLFTTAVVGDFDCSEAPDRDLETTCKMIQEWDSNARKAIKKRQAFENAHPVNAPGVASLGGVSPNVPPQFSPTAQSCMSIQCLCPHFRGQFGNGGQCFLPGGGVLGMSFRKEYRMMTDQERGRFHRAILMLKRSGEYDRLSVMHRQVGSSSGAHSGPGFLPWHREYMKRVEIALRLVDPGVSLPYWDSVMDSYLPDPRDSIMFTPMFMGEMDASGQVVTGSFAGFRTLEGRPNIVRRLATEGRLFSEQSVSNAMANPDIQSIMAYTAPQAGCPFRPNFNALEYSHSSVHLWIGGDMKPPTTSANDPIFFLHHSFVDHIWEMWRQMRQNRMQRETAYPPDIGTCANSQHFSYAQMRPWDKQNRDGLSNLYTDLLVRYAPRPTCSRQNPSCGSAYLFCDARGAPHCVAKVKMGGLCRGFEGMNSCFGGLCVAGWCRPGQFQGAPETTAVAAIQNPQQFTQQTQQTQQFTQQTQQTQQRTQQTQPFRPATQPQTTPQRRPRPRPPTTPLTSGQRTVLTLATSTCYNDDPCCDAWSRQGECQANRNYMARYCRRSCHFCSNPTDNRGGCVDRHVSCAYWRRQNFCTGRRQWMAENCQASCGWCNVSKQQLCASVAAMSVVKAR